MSGLFSGISVPEGYGFAYKVDIFDKRVTHTWSLVNDNGGVHIWGRVIKYTGFADEWLGGVECHWPKPPEGYGSWFGDEPTQKHCWLLDGPCWHDGTSLYFSERVAPMLPGVWRDDPNEMTATIHARIFYELLSWHRDKIECAGAAS